MIKKGFKRINFFKGFFTQAEDWQAAQEYHIEKRKVHNRFLHTPGIVYGCMGNLRVTATEGTSLNVGPGYAIDGEGRDLYLPKPERIQIIPHNYSSKKVYIIIRYNEEKIDKRSNISNPEYTDYAFIKEWPVVEITTDEPDNHNVIELARIRLSREASRVKNPTNPESPKINEVDMRYIRSAGVLKERLRLEDFAIPVKENDEVSIPSEKKAEVRIEEVRGENTHRFYFVSAYSLDEVRIIWHIESNFKKDAVEYRLIIENLSKKTANVKYRVYRL